jgi:serine/threonine protein phosphatase PrpC
MVSDGVTQGREDCVWLLSMLTGEWCEDVGEMARRIVERARAEGSEDDITVSIIKIEAA